MAKAERLTFDPKVVPHPGESVLEHLELREWSQRELARRTGLTSKTVSEICSGRLPSARRPPLRWRRSLAGRPTSGSTFSDSTTKPKRAVGWPRVAA